VFADRGRSGYKDEHRKKGRLGQLIAMAKDDRFEPGTVIVVEAWDRLGRLRPDRQTDLVAELLRTGVSIGVCRLDDIFCEDDFGTHKWTTLAVFIQLAFQESKQKAERVADSWRRRRERARETGELLTGLLPAWLEMGPDGEPRLIPERQAVIKRIFRLAADGYGHTRICGLLTREKVPPFGEVVVNKDRTRSQFAGRWTRPYIRVILSDRRVLGELVPRTFDSKGVRQAEGRPLSGYFPAAVTEAEFLLAKAAQASRNNGGGGKPRESRYVNVFQGILKHARDGEGFLLHNKGTTKKPELILLNASGNDNRSPSWTFPYFHFERLILGLLREIDPSDVLPHEKAASRADVLRAKLENVRSEITKLTDDLRQGYSKTLAAVLREKEAEEEHVGTDLQEELAKSVRPAARAWKDLPSLVDVLDKADDPEGVRLKLRTVLKAAVETMMVLMVRKGCLMLCAVQVWFKPQAGQEGHHRDYLLVYQPAAYRRQQKTWARSLSKKLAKGLDLRNADNAAKLQVLLEQANLKDLG
jgi:DNA invertase Pin-like site-specific DNA recombinase